MAGLGRYLLRCGLFLVIAAIVAAALHRIVLSAFFQNPLLNGFIVAVLLLGIGYNLRRIWALRAEQRWIEAFRTTRPGLSLQSAPRLIAPIAAALGERERRSRTALSTVSIRHLLDSAAARLDETREIARYLTGLMIFLGLLGTFWGLLEAISSVGGVINGLQIGGGDINELFNEMKEGLTRPLAGMGTAFSSSLFGLAGSLVLGFLDLQAGQAQNSFYNDVEEWLSGMTRFSSPDSVLGDSTGQPLPVYIQAMLEQTSENLDRLQGVVARSEEGRQQLNQVLTVLSSSLVELGERVEREQGALGRLAEQQAALAEQMARRAGNMLDEATREHIRNTDIQLGRLIEEMVRERDELKQELKLVARTIALAAGEPVAAGRG